MATESAEQRLAREGGENEARAGVEYHQRIQKKTQNRPFKPAKRAVGRKLQK